MYNWLYARHHGGQFVLRVEDTDAERSTDESLQIILDGLKWLGLDWDEGPGVDGPCGPYRQSERSEIYNRYLTKLKDAGFTYEDEGAIRFRVPSKDITVADVICGDVTVNLKEQGSTRWDAEAKKDIPINPDMIIRRPNGDYIFHFVNVVDDIEMEISHVIRGEDHLSNTPKHLALFEAFGAEPPVFAHIPLNLNQDGTKMSKRDQGALIHEYIEDGFLADAVNNYMALLGWSGKDDREIFSLKELVEAFDLNGVNKANSKFDYKKCLWFNAEHLKSLAPDALQTAATPFLSRAGIDPDDSRIPAALELARDRAQILSEIPQVIAPAFSNEIEYDPEAVEKVNSREEIDKVLAALISGLQMVENWQSTDIKTGIKSAAEAMGAKMGAFMLPCRVAATGSASGADLGPMLELIGKEKVLRRIEIFATKAG